jgi:hypothetical protein
MLRLTEYDHPESELDGASFQLWCDLEVARLRHSGRRANIRANRFGRIAVFVSKA